jgi:hypothetical protein
MPPSAKSRQSQNIVAWALLIVASICTRLSGYGVWNIPLVFLFAFISLGAALAVLLGSRFALPSIIWVLVILGVGLWPFFLIAFTFLAWNNYRP